MAKQTNNNFLVSLNGLKITDAQKIKINSGIQEVVMRELAQIDHTDITVKTKKVDAPISLKDFPFIWGIWVDFLNSNIIVTNQQQNIAK
jgi:Fe-S cluster assembly iron-binding protein IscA